ncbi:acetyl/propionyl/methylcrotonyl-CoA carboxylase subunit alpha [Pendulispora albinea]|uniref:Biotin/lipoyl-binding protein n=1 Tax=Pendulispora albinea TaxID=2741071 RepID=A0ABZ2LXH9_9BACT
MTKRFRRILVANRGEIAVRVLRGARALGYETVAVYSDADRHSLHVREAHRAVRIGPPPAAESYLSIPRLLDAAKGAEADAVHPGYGFLSERAEFARAVVDAGLTFIGPDPSSIEAMGNKSAAKARMIEAGVPCIPGYQGADASDASLLDAATSIGFPIMVKAAAGGGGRGMRLVHDASSLAESLRAARSEAESAFGSGELLLEKAIVGARHVEIQVFGDRHGHVVHLGERDCSIQRRNQKVVEEAPSPAVDEPLRAAMGAAAVRAAKAVNYVGAGTVEFLLDRDGRFYFLEMNTRLQVEHPVTELVYGVDLVAWQLLIARGEPLPLDQDAILARRRGHAIEVRLCTEDPAKGYLPQTGTVLRWRAPEGEGVRVDTHLETGAVIGPFYDSMQAKIVAHATDRTGARDRLLRALADTTLFGVATNRDFLARIVGSEPFAEGRAATDFLGQHPEMTAAAVPAVHAALAAVVIVVDDGLRLTEGRELEAASLLGWQSTLPMATALTLGCQGQDTALTLTPLGPESYRVTVRDAAPVEVHAVRADGSSLRYAVGAVQKVARYAWHGDALWLDAEGVTETYADRTYRPAEAAAPGADGIVRAHMDGKIVRVGIAPGDEVEKGHVLVVVEAMKLELEFAAPIAGTVHEVNVRAGDQVATGQVLVRLGSATATATATATAQKES